MDANSFRDLLSYNAKTGVFTWLNISKYHNEKIGTVAGAIQMSRGKSYVVIGVNGKYYKAHRLAWLFINNQWPNVIDHINEY